MTFIRFADHPGFRHPWQEFERMHRGLDELARFWAGEGHHGWTSDKGPGRHRAGVYPPLNVYEENDKFVISAEMPGVKVEDLNIALEGDTLTIQGKRERPVEEGVLSFHRREIAQGSFSRALSLPRTVDPERIEARLAQGILTITLMKASEASPRRIDVRAE